MQSKAATIDEYIAGLPEDRKAVIIKLRKVIGKNIPKGFKEQMMYGMPGYVVPHSIFPAGYHCDPKLPLGFLSFGTQKHFIALYHMGIYGDPKLLKWFTDEYPKHCKNKLDMGKACIRFKNLEDIPYELIGELVGKVSVQEYVSGYESALKRTKTPAKK